MKKIKNKIIIALCIMIFSTSYITVSVSAETENSIRNEIESNKGAMDRIEQEKNKIEEEKKNQDSELDKLFEKIDAKGSELLAAEKDVEEFQVKIDNLQGEIDIIQSSIDSAEDELNQKEKLITQKEDELIEAQAMLDLRIRSYYKVNVISQYIYMIIKSDGLGELLGNIQSIARIINIDRELMDSAKKIKKELSIEKDNLNKRIAKDEENKKEIVHKQSEIFEAQKEFIVIKDAKQSQMDELLALESEKENLVASLTDEELALQHEMGDLVAYNQELQAELDEIFNNISNNNNSNNSNSNNNNNNSGDSSGGDSTGEGFLRPVNGPVTDSFGERTNPVTGEPGFHKGVDFGDPYNTPIKATKSGVVTYSGWISGYGNSVIIDHGGGVTSLYGHAEVLNVSVNQNVSRGETIALVGSTGQSTGPHLHFEIRIGGQPVDPMSYF